MPPNHIPTLITAPLSSAKSHIMHLQYTYNPAHDVIWAAEQKPALCCCLCLSCFSPPDSRPLSLLFVCWWFGSVGVFLGSWQPPPRTLPHRPPQTHIPAWEPRKRRDRLNWYWRVCVTLLQTPFIWNLKLRSFSAINNLLFQQEINSVFVSYFAFIFFLLSSFLCLFSVFLP